MTNCPEARRRFPLVLAAGAMALILAAGPAAPAQAQDEDSEPIRLLPGAASEELTSGEEQPGQSPVTITDPEDEDEELEGDDATAEDENEDDEPVAVSPLRALDSSSVGVLGPEDGGLGPRLWEGASRPRIESLIARLPVVTESRAMKTLTRALLLTSAPVPEGEATVPSLLGLRVERLAAAGDMKGALDLVQVAPPGLEDPVLARVETDGFFLSGDHSGACTVVEREVANGRAGVYWIKGLSFCRALREEIKAARLGADLLREIGETGDEAFFTLIAALAGDPGATVVSLPDPRPLHIAMLRVAGQDIPADAVAGAGPALLRAIATAPNTDIAVKLAAGERAEALGALSPESLAQIYASVPFTSDELNNAVSIALKENSPRSRALLFQVGQIQTVPAARAEAMREAARVSRRIGGFATAARVNRAALLNFTVSDELAWFAGDAGLALLAAGEFEVARIWYDAARAQAPTAEGEATKAALDLWPLIAIAPLAEPPLWAPGALPAWWAEQLKSPPYLWRSRAGTILTVFESLGLIVPPGAWAPLLDGPPLETASVPAPALWRDLRVAAVDGHVGETVIYALMALGEGGPATAHPLTLEAVITGLRAVGLDGYARAIAIEAVLAQIL